MRHVSRTHRVALDGLFDRINLDPKIQIRYIDTKNQIADKLTKGNFTRDEWHNLLHLFNITLFSSTCCTENYSLISCTKTMALILNDKIIRPSIIRCRSNWSLFFVMVIYLEKIMEQLISGDYKIIFGTILCNLNIGLMKSGRAQWQRRRKQEKISILYQYIKTRNSLPPSSSWCHSGRSVTDPSLQDNVLIPNDLFEYICHIGCAINWHSIMNSRLIPGGQNFDQKTDSILHACGSYEQRTQTSWDSRPESTASCTIPADSVEETSKHCVLGRYQTCSEERIKVLSEAIERHLPLQYTRCLLYPEGHQDGNWRNQIRESIWVTSAASEDFL